MRWRDPKPNEILPGISEEAFLREAREYVEVAFPNLHRTGCPGRNRLEALAGRKYPPADEVKDVHHVVNCSPCFVEYRGIRQALKRKQTITAVTAATAAVAAAVVFGIFLLNRDRLAVSTSSPSKPVEVAQTEARRAAIDLRSFETLRGAPPETRRRSGSVSLPRENLVVTIQLPIGSEEGRYIFELLDSKGVAQIKAAGEGVIRDYVTTVEVRFDLRSLPPGSFILMVRRASAHATTAYPLEVR